MKSFSSTRSLITVLIVCVGCSQTDAPIVTKQSIEPNIDAAQLNSVRAEVKMLRDEVAKLRAQQERHTRALVGIAGNIQVEEEDRANQQQTDKYGNVLVRPAESTTADGIRQALEE